MARVQFVSENRFNEIMARAVKLQPQCAAAIDAATAKVYAEAVKGATRHHVTGNFARSIQVRDYGKAGGKMVIATDKNAQSIEYGHFLDKSEQPGQGVKKKEKKPKETTNAGPLKNEERAGKVGVDLKKDPITVWVNGTHIMRNAALAAGGAVDSGIAAAVKA